MKENFQRFNLKMKGIYTMKKGKLTHTMMKLYHVDPKMGTLELAFALLVSANTTKNKKRKNKQTNTWTTSINLIIQITKAIFL